MGLNAKAIVDIFIEFLVKSNSGYFDKVEQQKIWHKLKPYNPNGLRISEIIKDSDVRRAMDDKNLNIFYNNKEKDKNGWIYLQMFVCS